MFTFRTYNFVTIVVGIASKQLQIFCSIVKTITIKMMHKLEILLQFPLKETRFQIATKFFLHYKTMFGDISPAHSERMIFKKNKFIPFNNTPSSQIPRLSFSRRVGFFKRFTFLASGNKGLFYSFLPFPLTFFRTVSKSSLLPGRNNAFFSAYFTKHFNPLKFSALRRTKSLRVFLPIFVQTKNKRFFAGRAFSSFDFIHNIILSH